MPIKHQKDMSRCIAWGDIYINYFPGHYYRVFLWKDQAAMLDNTTLDGEERDEACGGIACHAPYIGCIGNDGRSMNRAPKRLGEIHFIRDSWNMEVVAHECFHASNNVCKILNIDPQDDIVLEERAAYIQGELVDEIYGWLWKMDRADGWDGLRLLGKRIKCAIGF